ncbi:hypothetical protein Q3H58_004877 [Pseudomonas psychrotolerans]|nr:hypothetical protein [Pseudomonas psychrotolerans]
MAPTEGLASTADQRREAFQRPRRVGQPGAVVAVLQYAVAGQLGLLGRRNDAWLASVRIVPPVAGGEIAPETWQALSRQFGQQASLELRGVQVRHYRQIEIGDLAAIIRCQGIDPGNALARGDRPG